MDKPKWDISVSATVQDGEVLPEFKLKEQLDENSEIKLNISKDKVYAEYNLKFN